jgi:two-component system, cell cycle response regulator
VAEFDETTYQTDSNDNLRQDARPKRPCLIALSGANVGEMFEIVAGGVVLGRGRKASIRLLDDGMSRVHARVTPDGDNAILEDIKSRNGTFRNGERIERCVLQPGDKIQLGRNTVLKFTHSDDMDESFQRQLYDSALRDPLTQTFNKRYFIDRLDNEFRFALRHELPLTVAMVDIDHFKSINDHYGHPAGDDVLCELSELMRTEVRGEDVLARYGGEEFAIVCRARSARDVRKLAERIRLRAENLVMFDTLGLTENDAGPPRQVTVSIGLASMPHPFIKGPRELIEAADKALYQAKQQGRNRVVVGPVE